MYKVISDDSRLPIFTYVWGAVAALLFSYANENAFLIICGLALMLLALVFMKFEDLFLFSMLLFPLLMKIKIPGYSMAIYGYFLLAVSLKYFLSHKIKLNASVLIHLVCACITVMIYGQLSLFTSLIRAVVLLVLIFTLFQQNSFFMRKEYIERIIIAVLIGAAIFSSALLFGFLAERNYATSTFPCIIAAAILLLLNTTKSKVLVGVLSFVTALGVLSVSSRTAFISLLCVAFIPLFAMFVKGKRRYLLKFTLVLLVILLIFSWIIMPMLETVLERFGGDDVSSANGRTDAWTYYVDLTLSTPIRFLFGNGFNSEYVGNDSSGIEIAEHNTFVQIFSTLGVVGSITLIVVYLSIFSQIVQGFGKIRFYSLIPLLCAAICYFGISSLYADAFHFSMLLATLLIRYCKLCEMHP